MFHTKFSIVTNFVVFRKSQADFFLRGSFLEAVYHGAVLLENDSHGIIPVHHFIA